MTRVGTCTLAEGPDRFGWSVHDKIEVAVAVIQQIQFLHSLDVLHNDVKDNKLMVDAAKNIYLIGFGSACRKSLKRMMVVRYSHPKDWLAPELWSPGGGTYCEATDAYGVGYCLQRLFRNSEMPKNVEDVVNGLL